MKERNISIDIFKGILTVQMVLAHCLQFFVDLDQNPAVRALSEYINLTTFSGFVFAFGFVGYHAYLGRPNSQTCGKLLRNMARLLVAFYLSGFAFVIFRENAVWSIDTVVELLLLGRLPGWSEFLFSFVCLMGLCLLLLPLLKRLDGKGTVAVIIASLLCCLLPYGKVHPILASFIGGTHGAYFPVVQYLGYFVIGIYFARSGITYKRHFLAVAVAATSSYLLHLVAWGEPSRFPPSIAWVVGAAAFLYLYYLLSIRLVSIWWLSPLATIGQQSLFYLVLSNVLIFALRSSRFYRMGLQCSVVIFVIIMLCCLYLSGQVSEKKRRVHHDTNIT